VAKKSSISHDIWILNQQTCNWKLVTWSCGLDPGFDVWTWILYSYILELWKSKSMLVRHKTISLSLSGFFLDSVYCVKHLSTWTPKIYCSTLRMVKFMLKYTAMIFDFLKGFYAAIWLFLFPKLKGTMIHSCWSTKNLQKRKGGTSLS
jgi:hypothetical protein